MPSIETLYEIAARGGGMVIDAGDHGVPTLIELASRSKVGTLTIKGANSMSVNTLLEVTSSGNGHVVFDFSS